MFELAYVFAVSLVLVGIGVIAYVLYDGCFFIEEYIVPLIFAFGTALYLGITAAIKAATAVKVGYVIAAISVVVVIVWFVKCRIDENRSFADEEYRRTHPDDDEHY